MYIYKSQPIHDKNCRCHRSQHTIVDISISVESSHTAVQEQNTCDDPWTKLWYSGQISKLKMFQISRKKYPVKKTEMSLRGGGGSLLRNKYSRLLVSGSFNSWMWLVCFWSNTSTVLKRHMKSVHRGTWGNIGSLNTEKNVTWTILEPFLFSSPFKLQLI